MKAHGKEVRSVPTLERTSRLMRAVALMIAIAVCMAVLFTGYIFNVGYGHSCVDCGCGICGLLMLVKHGTGLLLLACIGVIAIFGLTVSLDRTLCDVGDGVQQTPVIMKVKLLN